jgi:HEPN domain
MVMRILAEHYYQSALERIEQARFLYDQGASYALAMYVAGVAVECLLRAFKRLRDPEFDERHDLLRLFQASGMLDLDPVELQTRGLSRTQAEGLIKDLRGAVNDVYSLWANDFRYASEARLRAHLKRVRPVRKTKGDRLKAEARRQYNAASKFINRGVLLWDASVRGTRGS